METVKIKKKMRNTMVKKTTQKKLNDRDSKKQ